MKFIKIIRNIFDITCMVCSSNISKESDQYRWSSEITLPLNYQLFTITLPNIKNTFPII